MILGFKKNIGLFQTHFKEKILASVGLMSGYEPKLHTIRAGERWEEGMLLHMAYGVRTNQYEQFNKGIQALERVISVQDIFMTCKFGMLEVTIDDRYIFNADTIEKLIKNDGLTEAQFKNWFFPEGTHEFSGQIIHWTNLKY